MDRGSWRATVHGATVHGVCKELDTTEQLTVSSEKCFFLISMMWVGLDLHRSLHQQLLPRGRIQVHSVTLEIGTWGLPFQGHLLRQD